MQNNVVTEVPVVNAKINQMTKESVIIDTVYNYYYILDCN